MRLFIVLFFLIAAFFWLAAGYLIWFTPPVIKGDLVLSNVSYTLLSVCFAIGFSTISIHLVIGNIFSTKQRITTKNFDRNLFWSAIRRGVLITVVLLGLGILRLTGMLNILNALLILGIATLAEIYFSSR